MYKNKEIKATALYTALYFLPYFSSILLLPINTRYLSSTDYGLLALATVTQNFISVFFLIGIDRSIDRFYFDYNNSNEEAVEFLNTIFIFILSLSGIFSVVFFLYGDIVFSIIWDKQLPFHSFGWMIFLNSIFTCLNLILFQYYKISQDLKQVLFISVIPFLFFMIGGLIGMIILDKGALGNVGGKGIGLAIGSIPFYIQVFKKGRLRIRWDIIKKVLIYSLPLFYVILINSLGESIDKIIVNKLFSISDLGLYNLALTIVSPVFILLYSYYNAVIPNIYKSLSQNEKDSMLKLENTLEMLFLIGFISIWGLIGIIKPVFEFVVGIEYHSAFQYIPVLCFAYIGKSYIIIYAFDIYYKHKTKLLPVIYIASLIISIPLNYFFADQYGIFGVCIAVGLIHIPICLMLNYVNRRNNFYIFPMRKTLVLLISSILVLFANYIFIYKWIPNYISIINFMESIILIGMGLYSKKKKYLEVYKFFLDKMILK